MKDFSKLEKKLGVRFKNHDLLVQSLVHRSYINEHPEFKLNHNERLEFLGDAVLELIVTLHLYKNYPNPEGDLTNWRAALVNANMLAELAKQVGLEEFLYLSRGEARDAKSKARLYILANAFEALVGAIYLDQGLKNTKKFLEKELLSKLPRIIKEKLYLDPKSKFQEIIQDQFTITPHYKVLKETGPDHAKNFKIGVFVGEEMVATGEGSSKQEAQTDAAKAALDAKGW